MKSLPRFSLFFPIVCLALTALQAQESASSLVGSVDGDQYLSPTNAFRVAVPVLPELGGSVSDTDNVVTFQDSFNMHESIACFKMDATQRWEEETRGRKEYLIWFFSNFVQADFQQRFPGARIESAHFLPSTQSGTLLTYNLLPGGSMFAHRTVTLSATEQPVAKRGNLIFIQNGYVYVISIELAEKVTQGAAYNKTVAEEDALLRARLMGFLGKITFAAPAVPANAQVEKPASPAAATIPAAK